MIRSGHFRHELFWSLVTWRDGFLWSRWGVFVLAVDGSLRVGTLHFEREKMELRYFSFISGVVGVDCGPFQAFKVSDLYLDSYLYFSQPKTNPIYLFSIYKFYCYKLRVRLDTTENWKLKLKTEKYCSKIIFKCVNSTVGLIFNEKIAEKWNLWVHKQYTMCTDWMKKIWEDKICDYCSLNSA